MSISSKTPTLTQLILSPHSPPKLHPP